MDRGFRYLCFVLLPLCLVGCPSSNNTDNSLGAPDIQGIWQGKFTSATPAPFPLQGAIVKGYYGFLYDTNGDYFALPAMDDTAEVSTSGTQYTLCDTWVYCSNGGNGLYSFTATVGSDTIDSTALDTSTFTLHRSQPYSGTPHLFPGAWQGFYYGALTGPSITVNPGGTFTGNDDFCPISGTITQEGTSNLFRIALIRQFNCGSDQIRYKGVGYLVDQGEGLFQGMPGTYFIMGYSNALWAHVVEFKVQ